MSDLKKFCEMPGPYGYPIVGSALQLTSFPGNVLIKWAKNHYGNVFRFRMFGQHCVALNGFAAVEEGLITRGSDMSGRLTGEVFEATRDNRGLFYVDYGGFWKKWRPFTVEAVCKVMKDLPAKIEAEVNKLCSGVFKDVSETGEAISLQEVLDFTLAQVVFLAFMNKEFTSDKSKDLEDIITDVYAPFANKKFPLLRFAPWLSRFPPFSTFLSEQKAARQKMVKKFVAMIEEHHDNVKTQPQSSDIVQCFYKDNPEPTEHEKESLALLLADMIYAGTTTVAHQTMWTLLYMVKDPEVLAKCQKEVDDGLLEMEDVSTLYNAKGKAHYIRAVIQEVARLRPIAPISLYHRTIVDTNVGGFKVPKGVVIVPNIWSVHHDPETWGPDPDSFRPSRHLDENGEFQKSDHVIPFSVGDRKCAGIPIAEADIFTFVVTVISKYDVSLPEEFVGVDMKGLSIGILQTPEFKVKFSERRGEVSQSKIEN